MFACALLHRGMSWTSSTQDEGPPLDLMCSRHTFLLDAARTWCKAADRLVLRRTCSHSSPTIWLNHRS